MDWSAIAVMIGVGLGAAAAVYPKVRDVLDVVLGPKNEPNLRELLTRRLNDHEETLVEHEIRLEKLERRREQITLRDTWQ